MFREGERERGRDYVPNIFPMTVFDVTILFDDGHCAVNVGVKSSDSEVDPLSMHDVDELNNVVVPCVANKKNIFKYEKETNNTKKEFGFRLVNLKITPKFCRSAIIDESTC